MSKRLVSMLVALLLTLGGFNIVSFADSEVKTAEFIIVTQVYDFGQRASAIRIDYGEGARIPATSIYPAMFDVKVVSRLPDGTVHYNGRRSSRNAYVSSDGVLGSKADFGRYVFVELYTPTSRNVDGTITNLGSETWVNGEKLDLEYTVTWYTDPAYQFVQVGTYNHIVDRFESGEVTSDGNTLCYRLYDPSTAGSTEESYPLVLFLHDEHGMGIDNEKQLINNKGATLWAEMQATVPCYVLAPQTNDSWVGEDIEALLCKTLDEVIQNHKVDTNRIYIVGCAMGGVGTWNMLLKHTDYFAGALPMGGYVPEEFYANDGEAFKAIANMPIWAFVVANDDAIYVEGTNRAVDTITALAPKGESTIKFEQWDVDSVLPAHNCWEQVLRIGTPYNFLMCQSRARTEQQTLNAKLMYTHYKCNDEVTSVCDYDMNQLHIIDKGDKAYIIDSGTSPGDLYTYVRENVLSNPDCDLYCFLTHDNGDHYKGFRWFVPSGQIKQVYLHRGEAKGITGIFGSDDLFTYVDQGDTITIDDDAFTFYMIAGHTLYGTMIFYNDLLFSGDAVGSGDVFLGKTTVNVLENSLAVFLENMEAYKAARNYSKLNLLLGHKENLRQYNDSYIYDLHAAAQGIIDGSLPLTSYTRRAGSLYAGVNDAHIRVSNPTIGVGASVELVDEIFAKIAQIEAIGPELYSEDSYAAFKETFENSLKALQLMLDPKATELNYNFVYTLGDTPAHELLATLNMCIASLKEK